MSPHGKATWNDLRVLSAGAIALGALLAWLLYVLCFRPLAADAAAAQLADLVLLTQEGFAPLSSEQQVAVAADSQRHSGYRLVDDAVTPRLDQPSSAWLQLLADKLQQYADGKLELRVADDDGRVWVNVDTSQRRYWLATPSDRFGSYAAALLSLIIGICISLCLLAAISISHRQRRNLMRYSDALRRVGIGDVATLLPESGAGAERDFTDAFNTMARSLQRLDSESRLLLGGISHDLRTPLTSMRLGLELAKEDMEPGLAASLYQDAGDLESILNQFLDYARDDTLETAETGDLNELILEVTKRVSDRGHEIDLDLAPLPAFPFRKLAMHRLIINLVNNAINYAGVGVAVRTRPQGSGLIVISVMDGGPGIDESQLGELLRPFVRGMRSDTRHPGSGLGLTIASRITRIHGGTLSLRNRPEGGLEAQIELPTRYEHD